MPEPFDQNMFQLDYKRPENLPAPVTGGSVFDAAETPAQTAEREEKAAKDKLSILTQHAAAESDRLKKAQENAQRVDAQRIATELETGYGFRSFPKPMAPDSQVKKVHTPTSWCELCNAPHQLNEDGTFKPRDYSVPNEWNAPEWRRCEGPAEYRVMRDGAAK